MKRVIKNQQSEIITQGIEYKVKGDNSKLTELLYNEQCGFCVYTETFMSRTVKREIDHFNPKKENSNRNKYENLFLVSGVWNNEKSDKWDSYQPCLHPTSEDFESRIIYDKGDYICLNDDDEAANTIELLNLKDADLANQRKAYIKRRQSELSDSGLAPVDFFNSIMEPYFEKIYFLRAIENEFGIDIKNMVKEQFEKKLNS